MKPTLLLLLIALHSLQAADRNWTVIKGNDVEDPANWSVLPADNLTDYLAISSSVTNRGIPEWIRLVSQGNTFTCFYFQDGSIWTELVSGRTNLLGDSALTVGVRVTSP